MSTIASITVSVDGYVTGPDDGPDRGLGRGGERLHWWVMGGPWTYDAPRDPDGATGPDREHLEALTSGLGAGVCGRGMYDAAGAWGGTNPFPGLLVVLTHRTADPPAPESGFVLVDGLEAAMATAREAAGGRDVGIAGGADVVRQALAAGVVDVLAVSTAPVVLGAGKRLFEGFGLDLDLRVARTFCGGLATHVWYDVLRRVSAAGSR